MTTYRLMDGASGRPGVGSSGTQPPGLTSYTSTPYQAGTLFSVLGEMMWLQGYWWWVPSGGDTAAQKFCLWNKYGSGGSAQLVVPNSSVTSGTLTANAMNYIPLATPIQIAPGELYVCATGYQPAHGFPASNNQFNTGGPYVGGITNGPLVGWSDGSNGGTNNFFDVNYGMVQGVFGTGSAGSNGDPTLNFPAGSSNSSNFWMDVQVSDTAPGGYSGSYRLYPNMNDAAGYTNDTANNFTLGMEFSLSQACTINNVWFYSPTGVTQLPTEIGIYQVSNTTLVASNSSPTWSGAAGSGWMSAALTGSLAASTNYKLVVLNGAGSPAIWNATTANYWSTGYGGNGITAGPITAPNTSTATSPGQESYNLGATITFPTTYAGPYTYWLDIEVTPVPPPIPPTPQVAFMSSM